MRRGLASATAAFEQTDRFADRSADRLETTTALQPAIDSSHPTPSYTKLDRGVEGKGIQEWRSQATRLPTASNTANRTPRSAPIHFLPSSATAPLES
jgi:hypothetical protein